jgi:glycosyltransferase involved in cell wall biosynthesis
MRSEFLCTFKCTFERLKKIIRRIERDCRQSSTLKILQISSAQSLGGGERHLADLANGLARNGHDVYVAVRPKSPLIAELKDVPGKNITTLPLRNSLDAPAARKLSKIVRENHVEIVHAHMARDYPLAAYAARTNPGSRLIITRHVLFPLGRLHRITLAKAARIIAVSQAVAAQLTADKVVPPEKISVVLNGIDTARFQEARQGFSRRQFLANWKLPEECLLPNGCLLIGAVGELTPLKGQEEFLRAATRILQQHRNAYFVVAGIDHSRGKENRARLERLIEELRLAERVRLVGWIEDLAQLYCALDVFVSASHTESFGLAIAEAMASGTAVVATETEGARELIDAGKTGLLVPIGDVAKLAAAVSRLLQDKDEKTRLGTAAQQAALANFGVERMIAETEEIFRVEIQKRPGLAR